MSLLHAVRALVSARGISLFVTQCCVHKVKGLVSCYGVPTISSLLKIIGLFYKNRLFYRAFLQKRRMILRSLLIVGTP